MINIELHNILGEEEAYGQIRDLVTKVNTTKDIVVITKNGTPSVALIDVQKLEEMVGMQISTPITDTPPPMPAPSPVVDMPVSTPPADMVTPVTAPAMPDMPALPDMPSMGGITTAAPAPSPLGMLDDSPMNEPPPMAETPMSATPVTPVAAAAPVVTPPAASNTAPVMPLPVQARFGEDLPDTSDPTNGSPLA